MANPSGGSQLSYKPVVVEGKVPEDVVRGLLSGDPALLAHNIAKLDGDASLRSHVLELLAATFADGVAAGHFAGKRAQTGLMVRAFVASNQLPTELAAWCACVLMSDPRAKGLWGRARGLVPAFSGLLQNYLSATPYPLNLQTTGYMVAALSTCCRLDEGMTTDVLEADLAPSGVLGDTINYWLRMDRDVFQTARFQRSDNTQQETTWLSHILEQASHLVTSMCAWPAVRARVAADRGTLGWLVSCAGHRMAGVAAAAANALATTTQDESAAAAVAGHDSGRVVYDMVKVLTRIAKALAADHAQGVEDGHPDPFVLPPRGGGASIGAFQRGKVRKQHAAQASQLLLALGNVSGCAPGRKVLSAKGTEALPQLLDVFKSTPGPAVGHTCLVLANIIGRSNSFSNKVLKAGVLQRVISHISLPANPEDIHVSITRSALVTVQNAAGKRQKKVVKMLVKGAVLPRLIDVVTRCTESAASSDFVMQHPTAASDLLLHALRCLSRISHTDKGCFRADLIRAGAIDALGRVTRPVPADDEGAGGGGGKAAESEAAIHATATLEAIASKPGYWDMVQAAEARGASKGPQSMAERHKADLAAMKSAAAAASAGAGAGAGAGASPSANGTAVPATPGAAATPSVAPETGGTGSDGVQVEEVATAQDGPAPSSSSS